MGKCPHCLKDVSDSAQKCKHCGKWINNKSEDESILWYIVIFQSICIFGALFSYYGS